MELNKINSSGTTWGAEVSALNENFGKIDSSIEQLKNSTTRNKGYFSSDAGLKSAVPTATKGDNAYVGSAYPYQIWTWNGSAWVNSGSTGGEESVRLGDYYTKEITDAKFEETDAKLSELGSEIKKEIQSFHKKETHDIFVEAKVDNKNNLLESTGKDGEKIFYRDVQILGQLKNKDLEESKEQTRKSINELGDFITDLKKDVSSYHVKEKSDEFIEIKIDSENKLIESIDKNGNKKFYGDVKAQGNVTSKSFIIEKNPEYVEVKMDTKNNLISTISKNGDNNHHTKHIFNNGFGFYGCNIDEEKSIEYIEVNVDSDGKIIEATERSGGKFFGGDITFGHSFKLKSIVGQNYNTKIKAESVKGNGNLSFLWFSDIHGASANLRRIIELANDWGPNLIDCVINTGDTVYRVASDGIDWYDSVFSNQSSLPVLAVVGNHDAWEFGTKDDWNTIYKIPQSEAYELITKKVVQHFNVVHSGNNATYYYKDIRDVRIVVLDDNYWDEKQKTWFSSVLSDAISKNLSVVCANHHPFFNKDNSNMMETNVVDVTFSSYLKSGDTAYASKELADAVKLFIDNGGEFVCWLQGHTHIDNVYTLDKSKYGNQLCLVIGSARGDYQNLYFPDLCKNPENYTYDQMNMVSVDRELGLIKIMRIGANVDLKLRKRDVLVYDYKNGKVLLNY